jgi:hypothetical protein
MAHYNQAFAADEFDTMDTSLHDYPEPQYNAGAGDEVPVDPSSLTSSQKPSGSFTFIDFCPEYRRKPDAWFFQADYESFRSVPIAYLST